VCIGHNRLARKSRAEMHTMGQKDRKAFRRSEARIFVIFGAFCVSALSRVFIYLERSGKFYSYIYS